MKIALDEIRALINQSLLTKFDKTEAKLIEDVILFGVLAKRNSHGVIRLTNGKSAILKLSQVKKPEVINKSKVSRLIEGHHNPGILVAAMAANEVITLAKSNGFGIVGTKDSNSTSGCLSFYLEKISHQGLIGIIMARSPRSNIPFGGIEPLFGTNPIAFSIPSSTQPILIDMSTSAISWGSLLDAKLKGKKIPEHVALDQDGNPTTDPEKAMAGALLPFDGSYKGSNLSMLVEILSGILPGAGYLDLNNENSWGNLFIAFQPDLLINRQEFEKKVSQFIDRVKHSKTKDNSLVRIPGEQTLKNIDESTRNGFVEVDTQLVKTLEEYINSHSK